MINHFKYLLLILFSSFSFATTIHVVTTGSDETGDGSEGSPFATIQKGIDASSNGDTVSVSSGSYVENINYNSKNISIIGENRETTIIDGNQINRVVKIDFTTDAMISGFTIKNGLGGIQLGGMANNPTIENLIIKDNNANSGPNINGGGILMGGDSNPIIKNVIISNNLANGSGGGIYSTGSGNPVLLNVLLKNNNSNQEGDGIYGKNLTLTNVTIVQNGTDDEDEGRQSFTV